MNWEWLQWGFIGFLMLWAWSHQAMHRIIRKNISIQTDTIGNIMKMIQEMTGWGEGE